MEEVVSKPDHHTYLTFSSPSSNARVYFFRFTDSVRLKLVNLDHIYLYITFTLLQINYPQKSCLFVLIVCKYLLCLELLVN